MSDFLDGVENDIAHQREKNNEHTQLLDIEQHDSYNTASDSSDGSEQCTASEDGSEENEMNKPWPATYERSAEILAKPIVGRDLVVKATETMHILPPTKLKRNTSLTYLNRGYRTPDPRIQSAAKNEDDGEEDDEEEGGIFQRMGIVRAPSLDWRPALVSPQKQQRSVEEIKAYKQKLLAKKNEAGVAEQAVDDQQKRPIELEEEKLNAIKEEKSGDKDLDAASKTSFVGCICNVANTLLGIGILSLPFVLKIAGWAGGLFALLSFGGVAWWTSILLGRELNGDPRPRHMFETLPGKSPHRLRKKNLGGRLRKPIKSFPAIAREAFGQKGAILLSSVMYFELFSCLAVFLVSMGDHLQTLFPSVSMTNHMILVSALLMVATVLFNTPRLISYLSVVGTFTTVAVVLSVFTAALWEGDLAQEIAEMAELKQPQPHLNHDFLPPYHATWITAGLPIGYGLVAFCFSGHAVIPSIYNSMESPQRFEQMISYSFVLVLACCTTVAASGYYIFGSTVSDQITISLHDAPQIDAAGAMKLLTWLMIVTVFSKFSLYMFPLALGMEEIVAPFVKTERVMEMTYTLIKFTLIVSALCVAVFIPSFAFLCTLVGLICTVIVSVIFPAAAHLKLFGPHLPVWEKCIDWLLIVVGAIFAVVGTIATIRA